LDADSFNFTNNFTFLSGSAKNMFSLDRGVINGFPIGEGAGNFVGYNTELTSSTSPSGSYTGHDGETYTTGSLTMHGDTHTFITQVSLYNVYGECVAIARLSKPLMKTWNRETYIKVKLSY
jgi:hypothetical protein